LSIIIKLFFKKIDFAKMNKSVPIFRISIYLWCPLQTSGRGWGRQKDRESFFAAAAKREGGRERELGFASFPLSYHYSLST